MRRLRTIRGRAIIGLLAIVCVALFVGGCASQKAQKAALQPEDRGAYDFDKEGKIPALPESSVRRQIDRVDTFEEMPVESSDLAVESVEIVDEPIDIPVTPADSKVKTAPGYRIQLFASGTADKADEVKRAAELRLSEPVYIEIESGIFKVRAGDCMTREAAETLLAKCRESGYQDAWIANTTVVMSASKQAPKAP